MEYRFYIIMLCIFYFIPAQAEMFSLSQRVIAATNEPSLNLDYVSKFKESLSSRESAWLSQREVINVGVVEPLTPPFEIISGEGNIELEGIGADILSVLEKVTGKKVAIRGYSSQQQVLAAIENKEIDMLNISSLLPNTKVESLGDYSKNIMLDNCAYLASMKKISDDGDGVVISYEDGTIDKSALIKEYPKAKLKAYSNIIDAFDAVHFGQSDAIVTSISTLSYLGSSRIKDFTFKKHTHVHCVPLQFFIAKGSQPLTLIMNNLIAVLQKSSLMGEIDLRWRGGNYKSSNLLLERLAPDTKKWLESAQQIKVGLLKDDFPFSFINTSGQWEGIVIDVLNQIRFNSGVPFEFISFDGFSEMSESLRTNSIDMIGNVLSYQRKDGIKNTIPYARDGFLVLISPLNKNTEMSKIILSNSHIPPLRDWLKLQSVSLIISDDDTDVIRKLERNLAEFAIVPYSIAEYYSSLSKRPYKIIKKVGPDNIFRSFAVASDNKELLEFINKSLASMSPSFLSDLAHFWRISPLPAVGFYAQYADKIKALLSIALPLLLLYIYYSYRIHQELSARKKLEKVLLGQLDLMQRLLDGLPHPVTLVKADGTVLYSNKSFLSAVGYVKEGMQGANLSTLFHEDNNAFIHTVDKVVHDMSVVTRDREIKVAGSFIDIHEWFIPYNDIYDGSTGVLWGWFDVTWRNEICRQLEQSKNEADLANQAKSEFIATVSHEIRTPINIINGFLALVLARATLSDIDREELEYVRSAADSLLCLVGDVLDVTKIEAGLIPLSPSPINIGDIVHDVVSMFSTMATEKGVSLIMKSELEHCIAQLDPLRTKQILFNLIGNAVKFTHEGSIFISAKIISGNIYFSINDTGIGIGENKLVDLFKPFVQVHGESGYQGSGLGLNITKRLCELMGGGISISSEIGKGTEVKVVLPYQPVEIEIQSAKDYLPATSDDMILTSNIHVLIVDDHPVNLILLRRRLASLGFNNIHEADNGWLALDIVRSENIHIIITDCQMVGMDGFTLVQTLRQYEADSGCARHIILGLTASGLIEDRDKGMAVGMDTCMFKPIGSDSLFNEIQKQLSKLDVISFDNECAESGNLLRNREFINLLRDSINTDLASARKAYSERDIELFSMMIHRIKGVFLTIKHDEIVNCCKEIEINLMGSIHAQQIIDNLNRIQELMKSIMNEDD
ncbi:ATP-binding protein [Aeromonas dhakensis]|uniref:ATP-binding protein n=1 Tax=Aeromonas dhakensis TaxID=196024 RepID=UPI0038D0E9A2